MALFWVGLINVIVPRVVTTLLRAMPIEGDAVTARFSFGAVPWLV